MKKILIVLFLLVAFPVFAGEKENLQKDVQIYQLQLNNLQLQAQVIQANYPAVEAKLKEATVKLKAIEAAEKENKKEVKK